MQLDDSEPTVRSAEVACSCGNPKHRHGYLTDQKGYLNRLRRIEGQTRGLQRMVEQELYCIDIVTQISAVTKALEKVSLALLADHLRHCVTEASADDGLPDTAKIDEAIKAINRMLSA